MAAAACRTQAADERLSEWSAALGLTCAAPAEATWLRRDESRQAVLDYLFWRSKYHNTTKKTAQQTLIILRREED
jgi:hypothetical protein